MVKNFARRRSKAVTMIEMMFYMVIVAIVVGAAIALYTKQKSSEYHTRKVKHMQVLLGALENAKTANGGAYPATSGEIDLSLPSSSGGGGGGGSDNTIRLLAAVLGRDNAEYKDWKYNCSSGSNNKPRITVHVGDTNNTDLRVAVHKNIASAVREDGWTCGSYDGSTTTFSCEKTASCRTVN